MPADGADILDTVTAMQAVVRDNADLLAAAPAVLDSVLGQQFASFQEAHPALFRKASRPMDRQDLDLLRSMLTQLQNIADGSLSQHDADVELGEQLADRYIHPVVGSSRAGRPAR